ncbi:uncharacterized protein NPIL_373511, partial [Nephila pilipes]
SGKLAALQSRCKANTIKGTVEKLFHYIFSVSNGLQKGFYSIEIFFYEKLSKLQFQVVIIFSRTTYSLSVRRLIFLHIMDVRFWPSLQMIAYSRVARGILYTFGFETLNHNFQIKGSISDDYIRRIKEKVSECEIPGSDTNYLPLPTKIQEKLVSLVMTLETEVKSFFVCHIDSDLYYSSRKVQNTLSWYSTGILDRFETARSLIRNENIDIGIRFYFACKYYFEEDAQSLWTNMSEDDKILVRRCRLSSISIRHWLRALESRTELNWSEISLASRFFFIRNFMGIRYFFPKLRNREIRYVCIDTGMLFGWIHQYDLYYCLVKINADELEYVFRRLSEERLYEIFKCFLLWPFQTIFLDVVNCFITHISADIFLALICVLLDKVSKRWQDYEYVNILKGFWNELSSQHGECVEQEETLNRIMKYVLEAPVPFDVKDFRNFICTCDTKNQGIKQHGFQLVFHPWK